MPTNNEGTSFGEVLEQSPSYEDFNDASSTHSKEDQKDHHNIERENIIDNLWIKPVKSEISFESTPVRSNHENFLRNFFEIILQDAVFDGTSRNTKVVEWIEPERLPSLLDLNLSNPATSHNELLQLTRNIIQYSVKTGNPRFVNQLFSGLDPYGLAGQWLTDALNPSVYTYEVSPVFSLMEEEVLREMRKKIGWKNGNGDGIFCPGGSMANGYAINIARHYKYPCIKKTGLSGLPRLVAFTSIDAHYSIGKLAAFLGIGTNNVYSVNVDEKGKMCIKDLEMKICRSIDEGACPFIVSATSGTTVLGAFDSLRDINLICKKYNIWFHVDAAWGGGTLMSNKWKYLVDGIDLADSVTWNPHKMLSAPQQCSTFLTRHENILKSAHSANATYLFQKDKFYDTSFDSGDKHIQCGRRADVLKFWFMWKAKGTIGFEKHVDKLFYLSRYFLSLICNRDGWKIVQVPECINICFWYVPKSLRHLSGDELDKSLHKIAPIVKERMVKKGSMLVTYQPLHGKPNFYRLVMQSSGVTEDDMKFFVEEIEKLSEDLSL